MFLPHRVPIAHAGASPSKWLIVMHGIYGRGGNWRSFARKLCSKREDWGLLLTDLRMHGESDSAPPPHHLEACANDVLAMIDQEARDGRSVAAVLGHSFGGKVAMEMRRLRSTLPPLWLIDSSPSARPGAMEEASGSVLSVLRLLESLPKEFATRDAFVDAIVQRDFDKGLAMWLAMNLEPHDGGHRLRLDLGAMRELLSDYFSRDLWSAIEAPGERVHVVYASRSSALDSQDLAKLESLTASTSLCSYGLEGGHWLHVDALDSLVDLVASHLS